MGAGCRGRVDPRDGDTFVSVESILKFAFTRGRCTVFTHVKFISLLVYMVLSQRTFRKTILIGLLRMDGRTIVDY